LKPGSTSSDCKAFAGARAARADSVNAYVHVYLMIAASDAVRVGLAASQTGRQKPFSKIVLQVERAERQRRPKGKVTPL
jgi:hypothetical protein